MHFFPDESTPSVPDRAAAVYTIERPGVPPQTFPAIWHTNGGITILDHAAGPERALDYDTFSARELLGRSPAPSRVHIHVDGVKSIASDVSANTNVHGAYTDPTPLVKYLTPLPDKPRIPGW